MSLDPYFNERVPAAWNQRLEDQIARGEEGAELLEKMSVAEFGLEIRITGDAPAAYHLLVSKGRMTVVDTAADDPLVLIAVSAEDAVHLEREVGPSPMQLLGGVGGNPDFVITPNRIDHIRELEGTVRVQVTGEPAWGAVLHFGREPVPDPAPTVISIGGEEYAQLRAGELDLQGAFMTQKLALEGEVEFAMQMALALMAEA